MRWIRPSGVQDADAAADDDGDYDDDDDDGAAHHILDTQTPTHACAHTYTHRQECAPCIPLQPTSTA